MIRAKPIIRGRMAKACATTLVCALLTFAAADTSAGLPTNVTEAEFNLLPPYCRDVQGFKYGDAYFNTSPNAGKWVAMMGKGFWHMHHYCWALIGLARAQRASVPETAKVAAREAALADLLYVVQNTEPDFVMLPEIYTKIGDVLLLQKRSSEAGEAYAEARSRKPDYWPPYLHWAEHLRNSGQAQKAKEVVEEGLSFSPNSKPLQLLYVELGGSAGASAQQSRRQPANAPKRPESP